MRTQEPVPILVRLVGKLKCFVVIILIAGMLYSEITQQHISSALPSFLIIVLPKNKANLALYQN